MNARISGQKRAPIGGRVAHRVSVDSDLSGLHLAIWHCGALASQGQTAADISHRKPTSQDFLQGAFSGIFPVNSDREGVFASLAKEKTFFSNGLRVGATKTRIAFQLNFGAYLGEAPVLFSPSSPQGLPDI